VIVCAGRSESFDFVRAVGVGLVESTINLTQICEREKPKNIVFIGTCGLYDLTAEDKIGQILLSCEAVNLEISALFRQSYGVFDGRVSAVNSANFDEFAQIVSRETDVINSSNFITTDAQASKEFLSQGLAAENMEFFSILSVANAYDLPCFGVFVATNFCNSAAHEDFVKNHESAKMTLTKFAKEYLGKFA